MRAAGDRIAGRGLSRGAAALVLLVLAALLAIHAGDQWRYVHDDNGRLYSSYARTHLRLGLRQTGGQDFLLDPTTGRLVPYGHHPPVLGLLLAGSFAVAGRDTPIVARALPAAFHLVSAILVLAILRAQYRGTPALIAAIAFAVVPMSTFFGKIVNFEPLVLPFMIGAVTAYWRWAEGAPRRWLALSLLLAGLGALIDWPILVIFPVLAADAVRRERQTGDRRFFVAAAGACALGATIGGAVAAWVARPVGVGELSGALAYRAGLHGYPWWKLARKLLHYHRAYFTAPVLAAEVATAALLLRDWWAIGALTPRARLLALFAIVGIVPVIAFPMSARHHAYWQFYLLPYATLSLAFVLDRLSTTLPPSTHRFLYPIVVLWIIVASTATLYDRYAHPSAYVERTVRDLAPYL